MTPGPDEHVITRHDGGGMFYAASCSCGWETDADNPDDVEADIREHQVAYLGESTDVYLEE